MQLNRWILIIELLMFIIVYICSGIKLMDKVMDLKKGRDKKNEDEELKMETRVENKE